MADGSTYVPSTSALRTSASRRSASRFVPLTLTHFWSRLPVSGWLPTSTTIAQLRSPRLRRWP